MGNLENVHMKCSVVSTFKARKLNELSEIFHHSFEGILRNLKKKQVTYTFAKNYITYR